MTDEALCHHGRPIACLECVAEDRAASQPRQGGADGREAIKVIEAQYGPSPDGPWIETGYACAHKASELSDWSQPQIAITGPSGPTEWRRQRVVPYVPAESRQQQESGWVSVAGERVAYGPNTSEHGKVVRVLTIAYVDWDEGHRGSHEVTVLRPLPPPPAEESKP